MDFKNKRVTVIGLSLSGYSAAGLLKKAGAVVRISESRDGEDVRGRLKLLGDVEGEIGRHTREFIEPSDIIVVSPGVPADAPPLAWAVKAGIPVIGEMELGYLFCRAPIVAVTGTNGKSTTATLLHEMFGSNGIKSYLLGNIGRPMCEDVWNAGPHSVVTLEVSSFQLETISAFRPRIAALLNLTRDHLDRHRNMEEYRKAKLRIFENQREEDMAILNFDDPQTRCISRFIRSDRFYFSAKEEVRGAYLRDGWIYIDLGGGPSKVCRSKDIRLHGTHNLENVLAAVLALKLFDEKADPAAAISGFEGLPHRFEFVAEKDGVTYIDDSKATTVDSTVKALEGFTEKKVILIAGGRDKGSDYSPIAGRLDKIKHVIVIGEARARIMEALDLCDVPIQQSETMEEAVLLASGVAYEGDTVLLSPMCSSFDMFKDYKKRGEAFKSAVSAMVRAVRG